jgi:metallo-beta-lactamase family protein
MAKLTFLGATGCVTGSKYLLEANGKRLLVDCGLFQGRKELRLRNWERLPVDPATIDWVVLTHAHIDHTGYLPRLARDGFRGAIFANAATHELAKILLPDSARLQEEDAAFAAERGFSKHKPPLPLYTEAEAEAALTLFQTVPRHADYAISAEFSVRTFDAGHILGASSVEVTVTENGARLRVLFSGDLGRYGHPILRDPAPPSGAEPVDALVCESTYGDRTHPDASLHEALAEPIRRAAKRGGVVVIPAFAVGRTQTIVYLLRQLEDWQRIPLLPVFLDSPMAIQATGLYRAHHEDHNLEFTRAENNADPLTTHELKMARTVEESRAIQKRQEPCIIIAGSGMATGGRVLHHLKQRLPDARNLVLLVGFQAEGTRGRSLREGAPTLRIHGEDVPVRAEVVYLDQFSAHADCGELLRWLGALGAAPRRTFITHGEPDAARALRGAIESELGWRNVLVPEYRQSFLLES